MLEPWLGNSSLPPLFEAFVKRFLPASFHGLSIFILSSEMVSHLLVSQDLFDKCSLPFSVGHS